MDNSKLVVDLRARTFEIDVPHDRVDAVLDRLELFFSMALPLEDVEPVSPAALGEESTTEEEVRQNGDVTKVDVARRRGKATAKPKSYEQVELNLSPEQRETFRTEFASKDPTQQSELVAVTGYLLKRLTNKTSFTPNEIHSGIKIVNKPTPRNLQAVFGNMKRDGIGDYNDGKVIINSLTDDFVDHHMATKKLKKK